MTMAKTTTKQETMSRDLANRSPDIHWPEGFSPDQADLFSHNELHIAASCERVWNRRRQHPGIAKIAKPTVETSG